MYGKEERHKPGLGGVTWGKENSWKTEAMMGRKY